MAKIKLTKVPFAGTPEQDAKLTEKLDELKGVPVRLAMGGRDLENNTIEVMRRDTLEKETVSSEKDCRRAGRFA